MVISLVINSATLFAMKIRAIHLARRVAMASLVAVAASLLAGNPVLAQDGGVDRGEAPIIKYRTREEKREAGMSTLLAPWLRFQGEAESEFKREKWRFAEDFPAVTDGSTDPAVQFNFEFIFPGAIESEVILQYTGDNQDPLLEELILARDFGDWGFSAGRYYVPFGEYFSNFINGPLIEFAETRGDVVQVDYDFADVLEVSVFAYDGRTSKPDGGGFPRNWGASFQAKLLDDHVLLGGGWLSNVGDGDFRPLEDADNKYTRAVPAWNLYLIAEWAQGGISLEQVTATRSFAELDSGENSPTAWNIETAWYPSSATEVALRYEHSSKLADEPETRYGIEFTWRPLQRLSITVEYLDSQYAPDFAFDDEDRAFRDGSTIAASFAFIF